MARRDDEDFDERGLLKNGRTLRVPLMMRDADSLSEVQRAVMRDKAARGYGLVDAARHQPGPCCCTDQAANDARERAYQEAKREAQEAWKTNNNMTDWEVARVHDTGDPVRDAYLDGVADLTTAWSRKR